MRSYVFINKKTNEITLYGSIKAISDNQELIYDYEPVNYNRLVYLMRGSHEIETETFRIVRREIISVKKVIKK